MCGPRTDGHRPGLTDRDLAALIPAWTGMSLVEFGALSDDLAPSWVTERDARLSARPQRMRAKGAGRPSMRFPARLLVGVVQLRWNASFRRTGAAFGVSKDTVQRVRLEIVELLALRGSGEWRPALPDAAFDDALAAHDGTSLRDVFVHLDAEGLPSVARRAVLVPREGRGWERRAPSSCADGIGKGGGCPPCGATKSGLNTARAQQ